MAQVITRAPRYKRRETKSAPLFAERDHDLLFALYKYHLLTTQQLAAAHPGSLQNTSRRLRTLFDAGFLERFNTKTDMTEPGSTQIVHALTDRGADWLSTHRPAIERQRARYNERNARRTIASIPHTLMVGDVMLRFECMNRDPSTVFEFLAQHHLLQRVPETTRYRRSPTHWNNKVPFNGKDILVGNNPDQLFGVINRSRPEGRNTMFFFLEADRGTESVHPRTRHLLKSTIYKKMLGYYHTHIHRTQAAVFGDWMRNFRVLWVIDSDGRGGGGKTRLENFLETARTVTDGNIANLFLFTTLSELQAAADPLAHEWVNILGERRALS